MLVLTALVGLAASSLVDDLQQMLTSRAQFYNCSFSISAHFSNHSSLDLVVGNVSPDSSDPVVSTDEFVWGSVTKVWTGVGTLELVDRGLIHLDDFMLPLVDDFFQLTVNASLVQLFGPEVAKVTVRHLLGMQSGIPDFDTAIPYPPPPVDKFRADVYAAPDHEFPPSELLTLDWVSTGKLDFPPGSKTDYSSSNFMILGMLVAKFAGAKSWDSYNMLTIIPPHLRAHYKGATFVRSQPPADVTRIHGIDRTNYNSLAQPFDVHGVKGVFAGWSASDYVGSAPVTARFIFDVYGSERALLSESSMAAMVPQGPFYGLATFNLSHTTGQNGTYGVAYGHLGATYGYQSIVVYFPGLDFSLAIASSIETDYQAQPSDVLCLVYNRIKNDLLGEPVQYCEFDSSSYYRSACKCKTPEASETTDAKSSASARNALLEQ